MEERRLLLFSAIGSVPHSDSGVQLRRLQTDESTQNGQLAVEDIRPATTLRLQTTNGLCGSTQRSTDCCAAVHQFGSSGYWCSRNLRNSRCIRF